MLGFIAACAITIALETAIALFLLKGRYDEKLIVRNSVIASTLTLPFVWFVFPALGLAWPAQTAVSEAFAFLVEAWIYTRLFPLMRARDALSLSFVCNAASFLAGLAL